MELDYMSSKLPIVRQVNLLYLAAQFIIILLLLFIFYQVDHRYYIVYTWVLYLLTLISLRYTLTHEHRKGISLFKKEKFDQAIRYFENSYIFFEKHSWIDTFRFITLLSPSRISYTEMALLNKAFCLGQIGKKEESVHTYKQVLLQFPKSKMAEAALKLME
jgi:tetratricopeptide (TPR) repeat protein